MICKTCGEDRPESEFYKESRNRSGLNSSCKPCVRARNRTYVYSPKTSTPERVAGRRAARKRWLDSHRQERRDWQNEHNQRPEVKARRSQMLVRTGGSAATVNARRARYAAAEGHHTVQEWRDLCAKYDGRCLACGLSKPLTRDHVVPLSRGGTDWIDNIQPLCRNCNAKKGTSVTDYRPVHA